MTFTAMLALFSSFGSALASAAKASWPFIKKNWRELLIGGLLVWVVICCMSHCRGGTGGESSIDTVSVELDTHWVKPDTNAIFALYGFDTLPDYVRRLESRKQFKPTEPVVVDADNCNDSLDAYEQLLTKANLVITDCDSKLEEATFIRGYSDSVKNDSIEITVGFKVKGSLLGDPDISYRYTAPYPVITETITVKETERIGPLRSIYLEGGIGPAMTWENRFNTVSGSLGLGYSDKKGWSYGGRATFNENGYIVEGTVRKSFSFGK